MLADCQSYAHVIRDVYAKFMMGIDVFCMLHRGGPLGGLRLNQLCTKPHLCRSANFMGPTQLSATHRRGRCQSEPEKVLSSHRKLVKLRIR
jgi:hypothetical protein